VLKKRESIFQSCRIFETWVKYISCCINRGIKDQMDKGAHFYRCDFQIHTPRDRQWHGERAVSDAQRRGYARDFIAACRERGLDAVAITDHHDMVFVPYIREAAANEVDSDSNPITDEKRIVIFPGMELTLAIPCQALLIFDADFPNELFDLALHALDINQATPDKPLGSEPARLERITSFELLYQELDKLTYLRGRYIILPNVSENRSSSLLRAGHASHYKNMPCIGGYVDGSVTKLGEGRRRILSGQDSNYGNKALALFQTSDSRERSFKDLGKSTTWVKWAKPSAEALRQACLARESRISHDKPLLPSVVISSLNISNSAFMGPIFVEFNEQYNTLIGGRGTGKSTLLEYLRWGLCDAPSLAVDDEELPTYQAKRERLIKNTLTSLNASVQVNFVVNGVPHSVRRSASTNEISLKIGKESFQTCTEADVRNLLPIQAYSQKQLSNVGVRLDELRRFIHAPVRQELDEIDSGIKDLGGELKAIHNRLQQKRLIQQEIDNAELEQRSLSKQVESMRGELVGIDEKDQKVLSALNDYEVEENIINELQQDVRSLLDALYELQRIAGKFTGPARRDLNSLPNGAKFEAMRSYIFSTVESLNLQVGDIAKTLKQVSQPGNPYQQAKQEWDKAYEKFRREYDEAKAKSTLQDSRLSQLTQLEERLRALRGRSISKGLELRSLEEPERHFVKARERWHEVHRQRTSLLERQCEELTRLSDSQIRATLEKGSLVDEVANKLKTIVAGANIRSGKIDNLCEFILKSEEPIRVYQQVLDDLEHLAHCKLETVSELPLTPTLDKTEFTKKDLEKIARKLTPDSWLELCLVSLADKPVFEYRLREAHYIPFSEASAGQQATALLSTLLNQDGPPLIIDQPEDDLNTQVILQIVEQIWRAKRRRQLIFASHNANAVVHGDADLVICCDYRVAGEQAGGVIKFEGAIDMEIIKNEITNVLEGGKQAFKLRKEKYGF
jgi:chromosome segregation protein